MVLNYSAIQGGLNVDPKVFQTTILRLLNNKFKQTQVKSFRRKAPCIANAVAASQASLGRVFQNQGATTEKAFPLVTTHLVTLPVFFSVFSFQWRVSHLEAYVCKATLSLILYRHSLYLYLMYKCEETRVYVWFLTCIKWTHCKGCKLLKLQCSVEISL